MPGPAKATSVLTEAGSLPHRVHVGPRTQASPAELKQETQLAKAHGGAAEIWCKAVNASCHAARVVSATSFFTACAARAV